ncbi:MAG: aminodeoxychorismate synthase component I [Thioalkalivibrio sp.]
MAWQGIHELPYSPDPIRWFDALADRPWSVLLDSARGNGGVGRYDILAADPYLTLVTRGPVTEVRGDQGVMLTPEDPFALLQRHLGPHTPALGGLPFSGGAIGYFGYDLGRRIEVLPSLAYDDDGMPAMAMGLYDWAVVLDHEERRACLVAQGRHPRTRSGWSDLVRLLDNPPPARARPGFRLHSPLESNLSRDAYARCFERVQHYIREGDCYQVNLAQRFSAQAEGDPWGAYQMLRQISPAPLGAYLHTPFGDILSNSPERFLSVRDTRVETRPIKGTRARSADSTEDRALAQALQSSAKDRAENVMIVDLLRNDLGKTCEIGSVRVPELCALESYATVHHLVSTVTGGLAEGCDAVDLLRGCFPGGSITGAPKLRAMEIIEELEPHRRGVYCGSLGYVGFNGDMDTNIAIRTLVYSDGRVRFSAGGGLVVDSNVDEEYQETLDKAAAMLRLLTPKAQMSRVGGQG